MNAEEQYIWVISRHVKMIELYQKYAIIPPEHCAEFSEELSKIQADTQLKMIEVRHAKEIT